MPLVICDRLQRILLFANKVADEIVCEETQMLENTIPRMFQVMQKVAKFSCDYVKRGRLGRMFVLSGILESTDDRSEDNGWASLLGDDRRNG